MGFVHTVLDADPTWGALLDNLHVSHELKRSGIGAQLMAAGARAVAGTRRLAAPVPVGAGTEHGRAGVLRSPRAGLRVGREERRSPAGDPVVAFRYAWPDVGRVVTRLTNPRRDRVSSSRARSSPLSASRAPRRGSGGSVARPQLRRPPTRVRPGPSSARRTAATSASPGGAPGGRSYHATRCVGAWGSRSRASGPRDFDVHLDRRGGGQHFEQLADRGDGRLVAGEEERGRIARRWCTRAPGPRSPPGRRARRAAAHCDAARRRACTASRSSSPCAASTRRGVNVRIVGRRPSGEQELVAVPGRHDERRPHGDAGSSRRTLAAGSSTVNPSRSGPANVMRSRRGLTGTTARTATRRNRGGSRRVRAGSFGRLRIGSSPPAFHLGGRARAWWP